MTAEDSGDGRSIAGRAALHGHPRRPRQVPRVIGRRAITLLGISQLVCWGISYYLVGVFGDRIGETMGWGRTVVYGGFSVALLVMGVASPMVGRFIDRVGGGKVMAAGSVLCALGCTGIAAAHSVTGYYAAWVVLGLAMRATLYDAAFATLARIGGPLAQRPMAKITLLGGLASTCFWPIGHLLGDAFGWRIAVMVYAATALLTVPLHLALPKARYQDAPVIDAGRPPAPAALDRRQRLIAALLYAVIFALTNALNAGMSAHMIPLLSELGLAAAMAVSVATLRGIGQSSARLAEVLFGGRLSPADLNLLATLALPVSFTMGLAAGGMVAAAAGFALFYGAGNGILSITRGTLPLVLFDVLTYGAFVGRLLVPSFLLAAAAPLVFAVVIERFGAFGAMYLSIALASVILAAAVALKILADGNKR